MKQELNVCIARKVLETVDHGLVSGLGKQKPGQMCVEAAVCYAYGLPHGDNPPCVGKSIRAFKISLNDRHWSSPAARAKGMRALAIAQLGSDILDQEEFRKKMQKKTIQTILPKIIRLVAGLPIFATHQSALLAAASDCEVAGTPESAIVARDTCRGAASAALGAADTAASAATASYARSGARPAIRDEWLTLGANICLEVLKEMKSPGCEYLYLLDQS